MSMDQNRGSVVQEGTGSTYQSAGTFSHKVCHFDKISGIHIQADNMTAFSYLLKMGGAKNPELMQISKEIWEFLLGQEITITAEHLPGNLNCKVDWESRHQKDSSEWRLCPLIFSKVWQILGKKPEIDLFASRLSNQLPSYYSWKPDPNSLGTDALQQKLYHKNLYAFLPFALIHKVLKKVEEEKVSSLIIVTPTWQTRSWYPELLRLSVRNAIILPLKEDLLKCSQNQQHPLIQNRTMQLAVWVVSGKVWQKKEYQEGLQTLLPHQEEKVLSQIIHRPGISGLAGVLNNSM